MASNAHSAKRKAIETKFIERELTTRKVYRDVGGNKRRGRHVGLDFL
jgi:hypothetical protein